MNRFFYLLSTALLAAGTASAQSDQPVAASVPNAPGTVTVEQQQPASEKPVKKVRNFRRIQIGLRGGFNVANYKFPGVVIGDARISPGPAKAGYSAGLIVRLNISKHLHIQSEFNYDFVNYSLRVRDRGVRDITTRTERFEIPLQLGLQFGPLRLFGGPMFRVAQSQRPGSPYTLKVNFNNDDIGLMGGVGIHIRKFFLDFRMSGYPGKKTSNQIVYDGVTQRVKVSSSLVYGGSIGFYF